MISRSSFWVSMKENSKRRLWVIALLFLVFFFYFPVAVGLRLGNYSSQIARASEMEKIWLTERMIQTFEGIIGADTSGVVLVVAAAILCALQGFSYLYNRKKVDFYHALPISKGRRFSTIYFNGIVVFFSVYLINLCMGVLVGSLFGLVTPTIMLLAIKGGFYNLLLYMAIYSITIMAAVLTGNLIVAFMATGVLLVYEVAVRALIVLFAGEFFETYSYYSEEFLQRTFTSPVMVFTMKILQLSGSGMDSMKETFQGIMILVAYILVYTGIGYLLYRKRPMENSGKAMAFPLTKRGIKLCLMIPLSIGVGGIFYGISNSSSVALYIGCILGIIIFQGLVQVIYEFDMKAVVKEKKDMMITGVLVLGFIVVFQFDLIGYDSYIPKASELDSVSMQLTDGVYYENYRNDNNTNHVSDWEYYDENMFYTDAENIIELASKAVEESMRSEDTLYLNIDLQYRLQNGTSKYRSIYIPWEENLGLMDEIYTSEEYGKAYYQILNEDFMENNPVYEVQYEGDLNSYTIPAEKQELFLSIYQEELASLTYTQVCKEIPVGSVTLVWGGERSNSNFSGNILNYPVYETFTETLAMLEQDEKFITVDVEADQVEYVTVYVNYEENYQDFTFVNEEDIANILDKMIPYYIENFMASTYKNSMDTTYWYSDVRVSLKESINDTTSVNGVFERNNLPEVISESIYLN